MLGKIWNKLLDILFPRICINCRRYLESEDELPLLCRDCFESVEVFRVIFRTDWGEKFLALGPYENDVIKTVIHCLKYRGVSGAIEPIKGWIKQYLTDLNVRNWIDGKALIVPVPLHPARLRRRGFNQAQLIAEVLSDELGLNIETEGLKRIKNTRAQAEIKNKNKRKTNVQGCFVANREKLSGRSVLLVDDVYTSGATVREAIRVLKKEGTSSVTIFVLAKTNNRPSG